MARFCPSLVISLPPAIILPSLLLMLLAGCNGSVSPAAGPDEPSNDGSTGRPETAPAGAYFPVADFLKTEIRYVDSLPVGIVRYHSTDHLRDTSYITLDQFHNLASEFLPPQLETPAFNTSFTETSLYDKSTQTATFLYTPRSDTFHPIRRVDITVMKGDVYDEVQSVYLEKTVRQGDSTIIRKLYWKPKRNFQIITQSSKNSTAPRTEIVKVEWDNRE